jgi:hypothetical protein
MNRASSELDAESERLSRKCAEVEETEGDGGLIVRADEG